VLLLLLFLFDLAFILNLTSGYLYKQIITTGSLAIDVAVLNALLVVIVLVPTYVWSRLWYERFVYVIRDDELIVRKGILRRSHTALPYSKIRDIQRRQSYMERLFGLCTISIETAAVSLEYPPVEIPGILNVSELPELILKKTHEEKEAEMDLGKTMREILSEIKELNKRVGPQEDKRR
jgi:putative membrane protein